MKKFSIFSFVLLTLGIGLVISSCKKTTDPVNPKIEGDALFTYVANGLEVTFTNTSTVSGTYAWDFGDGETSTDKNPVHTYAHKGEYTVALTVKDSNGDNHDISTKITVDKSSPVVLDDNSFDDWATIQNAFTIDSASGAIRSFKYDFDDKNIYFYIKQEASFTEASIFDMLIDTDPDAVTNYQYTLWPLFGGGELLIENSFSNSKDNEDLYWMDFANYDPNGTDWDTFWIYDTNNTADAQIDGTYKVNGNIVEIEWAVSRTKIAALNGKDVIKIVAWTSNQDWDEIGWIPSKATPDNPDTDGIIIDMR